jgi:hypothetical protein
MNRATGWLLGFVVFSVAAGSSGCGQAGDTVRRQTSIVTAAVVANVMGKARVFKL